MCDIPSDYLDWLWNNAELYGELRSAVAHAMMFGSASIDDVVSDVGEDRIKSVYRSMARKWHPDHGGTHEAMTAVNEFYELLTQSN